MFADLKADIDHNRIETQADNKDVEILCSFPKRIVSCSFKIPGVANEIKLSDTFPSQDPRFEYIGTDKGGRDNGQCGIRIKRVEEDFHGTGLCRLDPDGGQDAIAEFEIIISRAPEDPKVAVEPNDHLAAEDVITAECVAEDARPAGMMNVSISTRSKKLTPRFCFSQADVVPRRKRARTGKHHGRGN